MGRPATLLVTVALGLAAAASAWAHDASFDSFVNAVSYEGRVNSMTVKGSVSSDKPQCEPGRVVRFSLDFGDGYEFQAKDTTNDNARWRVEDIDFHQHGTDALKSRARVTRRVLTPAGHTHVCKAAVDIDG